MRFLLSALLRTGYRHLPASPYVQAIEAPDYQVLSYHIGGGTPGWVDLPLSELGLMQGLVLFTDQTLGVRLYRQMDGEITVNAGGVLVLWNTHIRLNTLAPVQLNYGGAVAASIRAIAIGIGHENV